MINLLIGPPGGGKSYEATVYHVLPALRDGRKVITNLPLIVEMFARLDPSYPALIDLRKQSRAEGFRPFGHIADYGDPWRHPETGTGPLYIIDEAHEVLPKSKIGQKGVTPEVGEWFATHRHEFADVLIITQHYGRVSGEVIDRLQLVYRVKKMTAFGKADRYIRKVQDGLRGEVMDMQEREYESRFYSLYTSHTRSSVKGIESAAADVRPRYKKFIKYGFAIAACGVLIAACQGVRQFTKEKSAPKGVQSSPAAMQGQGGTRAPSRGVPAQASGPASQPASLQASAPQAAPVKTPFDGMGVHVSGYVESGNGKRRLYLFTLSQNGQGVSSLTLAQVERTGYTVTPISDCVAQLQYKDALPFFARCDAPQIQLAPSAPQITTTSADSPSSHSVSMGGTAPRSLDSRNLDKKS